MNVAGDRDADRTVPGRRTTLADVAARAGVSRATASRALRGDRRISERTSAGVHDAAESLGYVPNLTARHLRSRRTHSLGLLLSDMADPDHGAVGAGFEQVAAGTGYTVLIVAARKKLADERRALKVFQERGTDGVCIASSSLDPAEAQRAVGPAPLLVVQPDHPGLIAEIDRLPAGTIRADDVSGVSMAVRHLASRGYQDIAYLGAGPRATNSLRGSIAERVLREETDQPMRAFQVTDEAWRTPDVVAAALGPVLPEAIVCYDDKLAIALLDGLRARGVRVPDDVAVVGYDGIPFAAFSNPRLTTVATPSQEMGRLAARTLVEVIATGKRAPPRILPVELVVRESSRARSVEAMSGTLVHRDHPLETG
jgi:LacI family transcriptional regulator